MMEKIPSTSYRTSLAITTRNGAITAGAFHTFFVLLYAVSGYPTIIVGINLFCLSIDLLSLLLIQRYRHPAPDRRGNPAIRLRGNYKPIAHTITFSIYISLFGPALFSGGISSSSLVWLIFVPVAGTIMAGRGAGSFWGTVSIASAISAYILKDSLGVDFSLIPVTDFDRMIDIVTATLATTAAIWLNETSKSRALKQLEDIGARLDHLATTDSLTDTYNRRYFMERARDEILQSPHAAALLMFDIDHFKKINDDYGHNIGDQVLQGLCKVCKANLRENDLFARFGGEEFIILLPATDLGKAQQIAERLCKVISKTPFMTSQGELSTTISVGISTFSPLNQVSIELLLVQADKAMYKSKQAGRNRVTVWKNTQ